MLAGWDSELMQAVRINWELDVLTQGSFDHWVDREMVVFLVNRNQPCENPEFRLLFIQ